MKRIRKWFFTGIAVVLPTVVTAWILWKLFGAVDGILDPVARRALGFRIPGLGFITVMVLLILAGFFAGNFVGTALLKAFERLVQRVPLAGRIYRSIKQILEVFTAEQAEAFKSVVTIEYPRQGLWAIGFVTRETPLLLSGRQGERSLNVFVPTSPNPTSGFLLIVPESECRPTALSVEEALKIIISGGAYVPPESRAEALPAEPESPPSAPEA